MELETKKDKAHEESGKTSDKKNQSAKNGKIAILRIRGVTGIRKDIKSVMECLGLKNVNNCIVLDKDSTLQGKLNKIKDYCTFGDISEKTAEALKAMSEGTIRLSPRKGGYGSVKKPLSHGGCLGKRNNMDEFIKSMIKT